MTKENLHENVEIREYRDSDYETCRSLWVELAQYHQEIYKFPVPDKDPGKGFDDYLNTETRRGTWVAEIKGKVVGLAGLLVNSEVFSEVEPIIVSQQYRGRGIGGLLMKKVVGEAGKTGCVYLSIRPGARNKASMTAFVRLGFDHVWTVELIRELKPGPGLKWLPGLKIHDNELGY